jgi:hypothetical protein
MAEFWGSHFGGFDKDTHGFGGITHGPVKQMRVPVRCLHLRVTEQLADQGQ